MSLIADLNDGKEHEITQEEYVRSREVLPPVVHGFDWNAQRWDFGFAEGLDYVYAFRQDGDRYFARKTPFVNPNECGRSVEEQQARPELPIPDKLTEARVADILRRISELGLEREAVELRWHIRWLEGERDKIGQYYEEFVIPQMEGRPIGKPGRTWADRMQEHAERERTP